MCTGTNFHISVGSNLHPGTAQTTPEMQPCANICQPLWLILSNLKEKGKNTESIFKYSLLGCFFPLVSRCSLFHKYIWVKTFIFLDLQKYHQHPSHTYRWQLQSTDMAAGQQMKSDRSGKGKALTQGHQWTRALCRADPPPWAALPLTKDIQCVP